jgi:hypothetical protein
MQRFFSTRGRRIAVGVAALGAAVLLYVIADDIAARRRTIEAERVASRLSDAEPGTEQYEKDTRTGRYDYRRVGALFKSCQDKVRRQYGPAVIRFGTGYPFVSTDRGQRVAFLAEKPSSEDGSPLDVPIEGQYMVAGSVDFLPPGGPQPGYYVYRCLVVAQRTGFAVGTVTVTAR